MTLFRDDPRPGKIDLGVGVYRDASGLTPVMRAVKAAERQLVEAQDTKVYTGFAGDPTFAEALSTLILGPGAPRDRLAMAATPGGTGAVHQGLELIQMAAPEATIWISDPSWPNHPAIVSHVGMAQATYRYFDADTGGVDVAGMMEDLSRVAPGDAVILHGCCHNPTGANLTLDQWGDVARLLADKGAVPFIDIAYQGFGDGLEADAAATRLVVDLVPEAIIAASCSKNFGIYRERAGLLMALAPSTQAQALVQEGLVALNRLNFSFPPDHGARTVTMILNDPALRADWEAELEDIRVGMLSLREQLATALRDRCGSDRFGFLAAHRGMFSRLGATPGQVEALRHDHSIYMVGDSRMNIAGLNTQTVPVLADAIIAVGV